jgi:GAF domain-containing protein
VVVVLTADRQTSSRLLDAVISVSQNLRLREVLQGILGYACELVDARYGALGVTGQDNRIVDVIFQGVDDEQHAAIGRSPLGRGVLGDLIAHPEPIRLAAVAEHPRAFGFPPNHPPMASFLGVPLKIRDEVFGNLYVAEKLGGGEFTEEDQHTLATLGTAAGIAVDNARMYEWTQQRERWLAASNEITTALLGDAHPTDELKLITERAKSIAGAPAAAIALPDEEDQTKLVFEVVDGLGPASDRLVGTTIDVDSTASGIVYSSGKPLLLDQYGDAAATWQEEHKGSAPQLLQALGSAAIVPLAAGDQTLGVLLLIRLRGEPPFGEPDLELLRNFAAHAAIALQYAKARADQRRLAVFEDRDRIATDMQDLVISRLFDIGLGLQGMAKLVPGDVRRRVATLVDELDETIRNLRRSIFSLQDEEDPESAGTLDDAVLRTASQAIDALGFEPRILLHSPLDSAVPQRIRPDLLATLRESLSNVAKHAFATKVTVELEIVAGLLTVSVVDDGIGIDEYRERNSGLGNLGRRARKWGGDFTVEPGDDGGTRLNWTVPL